MQNARVRCLTLTLQMYDLGRYCRIRLLGVNRLEPMTRRSTARGAWRRRGCAHGRPARSWRRWWPRRSPRSPATAHQRPAAPRGLTAPAPQVLRPYPKS